MKKKLTDEVAIENHKKWWNGQKEKTSLGSYLPTDNIGMFVDGRGNAYSVDRKGTVRFVRNASK